MPLSPIARQFIEAAKARLEASKQPRARSEPAPQVADSQPSAKRRAGHSDLTSDAERLAAQFAQEKAKREAQRAREAERQVQEARERQLKQLYAKGLALYRQGAYEDAVQVLQQMAMIDPSHELVKAGNRLMAQAEAKHFEQRARIAAKLSPGAREAVVPELEKALTEKRIEQETVVKYAKSEIHNRNYDFAIELLYRVLHQDPTHRQAQQLIDQARAAKLKEEEDRLTRQAEADEQRMLNDVTRSGLLPPDPSARGASSKPVSETDEPSADMVTRLAEPISFDFQEVSLSDVLDFLGDSANVSIMLSPRVDLKKQTVTLRVDQLPLGLALKYVVKNLGLAYRVEDNVIIIGSPEEFANAPLQTRVFNLRSGIGPFALEAAAVQPNPILEMDSLKKLIEQSVPQPSGSKLVMDERSGSLIVTNTGENLHAMEELIEKLDVSPVQVLIEARFMEVNLSELEHVALESVLTGDVALNKKFDDKNTLGAANQIAKGGGFKFPALARESEGANLTLQGVLTGTQFETVLHLLEETQKSKTLSAPRVTTLNHQTATIKVVDEFRYPTRYEVSLVQFDVNGDGDFDDAGETEFVNVPQDFQKRDIGVLLHVTPSVGEDQRAVTLVLAPEVSQFSQFRDLGGGVTVPEFTSSQLTTSVSVEAGQTVVLGGLMKDSTSEQLTKVPVLGDLPVLGSLFRQRSTTQTQKNLLIFVRARILNPRGPADPQRPTT